MTITVVVTIVVVIRQTNCELLTAGIEDLEQEIRELTGGNLEWEDKSGEFI